MKKSKLMKRIIANAPSDVKITFVPATQPSPASIRRAKEALKVVQGFTKEDLDLINGEC